MKLLDGLRAKLVVLPKLPDTYTKAEKSINGLIDSCIADLQQLKVRHHAHIYTHVSSYRKFEQLHQKLLNGEQLNTGEGISDAVAKMLKEIENTNRMGNPYCLSGAEVEQHMADMRQRMAGIRISIETLWTKSSVKTVDSHHQHIHQSKQWRYHHQQSNLETAQSPPPVWPLSLQQSLPSPLSSVTQKSGQKSMSNSQHCRN
jgi:hypothetical protein